MAYEPLFKLKTKTGLVSDLRPEGAAQDAGGGDRRDGLLYLYDEDILLALDVALATGRPLLVTGPSGCGKSSLAFNAAQNLGRRYYEFVVTARTQAQDLTWRFDAVRRLADAQVTRGTADAAPALTAGRRLETLYPYIEPRELWWVFHRASALRRGRLAPDPADRAADPRKWPPLPADGDTADDQAPPGAVLLIDEIDKADPDVPNNLLVPLGSLEFDVDLLDLRVRFAGDRKRVEERPLIIITSNGERPLPAPFLRRCVALELAAPRPQRLKDIATANFGQAHAALFDQVLEAIRRSAQRTAAGGEPDLSIAEYIDTVRACIELKATDDQLSAELLEKIVVKTVWKNLKRAQGQ